MISLHQLTSKDGDESCENSWIKNRRSRGLQRGGDTKQCSGSGILQNIDGRAVGVHSRLEPSRFQDCFPLTFSCSLNIFIETGILGLTGALGFLFYIVAVLGLWCMLLMKSGSNWQKYFISRQSLLTNGFLGGLCTYVLFWTFLYGMVHVY